MNLRRLIVAAMAALLLATGCTSGPPPAVTRQRVAGVQLFMWSWDAIAAECTSNLGPNNYAFVLTSPPQEHITGEQWWTAYQPVSYRIESRLGTRAQFKAMVDVCHAVGVKVIADAVINHMSGIDGGVGWAGSSFTHYDYPGIYTRDDFHTCATSDGDIHNYQDATEVQSCELVNLADLKTETERVRATVVAYLTDLRSLGVDGFRIDAAKHMPAADVEAIVKALPGDPIIISEVIRGAGEPIQPEQYLGAGGVFAFGVAKELSGMAKGSSLRRLAELTDGTVPSAKAYPFVTNHDTERNSQTLNYKAGNQFELATVMLLAQPYGTPMLYSGYAFDGRDDGPKQDASGAIPPASCAQATGPSVQFAAGDWVCEHRWATTVGMLDWRSVVGSSAVENLWSDSDAVAFDRGALGFVAISTAKEAKTIEAQTNLPDGTYCDALTSPGPTEAHRCKDGGVQVKSGKVTVTVPPSSAVALHVGLRR